MPDEPIFRMEGVSKRYGGVVALAEAELAIRPGRIHAVLGENGAGKSTLIKIMSGVVQPDEGRMTLDARPVTFPSPAAAGDAGIVCVFQELSLVPDLSVADNILIRQPPTRLGMIDGRAQRRIAEAALARAGAADIHPRALIKDLPLSRRQMVEIAKALAQRPRILILDEATSALTAADVGKVFDVLKRLRDEGLALVYISHRMHEIEALADECTVFRNGRNVATYPARSRTDQEVVEMMIGREYRHVFPPRAARAELPETVLAARGLSWTGRLRDVSFDVGRGEVVGLGGLDGQGQREILLALFGVLRNVTGTVRIHGRDGVPSSPGAATKPALSMALIPEDRKTEGLMLPMSIADNISITALKWLSPHAVIDRAAEKNAVDGMVRKLQIKVGAVADPVATLSGGNQQKVVIAKWLLTGPQILLLNDPTRGIDVGTKEEIYRLLRELADAGTSIILYSTDYDELIGCCDRVLILYGGRIVRTLEGDAITETNIVASSFNLPLDKARLEPGAPA